MREHLQIAIDGPAGSGKSTIGDRLARRLGYTYVDTGALYRALTVLALERGADPADGPALAELARDARLDVLPPTVEDGRQYTVLLDGRDITPELRSPAVEVCVSQVSAHQVVRQAILGRQRALADIRGVVMVGRDIGTVVLPGADLKVYLHVSVEERARRRHGDLVLALGPEAPTFEQVREDIARRDALDAAQMRQAEDAVVIHTDAMQADEVVAYILGMLGRLHERV
jgi:cytidylate kinase